MRSAQNAMWAGLYIRMINYCGYCGCKVFDFSVTWEQEPRIYASDDANIHGLTILVENTGAYPIAFQPIRTTRDDVIRLPQGNGSSFTVSPGQQHPIPIQVNPAHLGHETSKPSLCEHKMPRRILSS